MSVARLGKRKSLLGAAGSLIVAALAFGIAGTEDASAYYIGPSYLTIPGVAGGVKLMPYHGWVRAEANYWTEKPNLREIRGITGTYNGLKFTGTRAPQKGPSMLAVSVDKMSPDVKGLMDTCRTGAVIPEVSYAESSEMARHPQEHGPRPADVPEYYEYVLKNVRLTCPVVANAPEQAFGLHFDEIVWANSKPLESKPRELTAEPAKLRPGPKTGITKAFVISWFAPISDSRDDQCPKMNTKPPQDDYYALMTKERAAQQREFFKDKGGVNTMYLANRGPDEMNVIMLPGIVADPGHSEPQVDVVRGFNLDGDDGSGPPPAHTTRHKNYVSPDGRTGIDNQLFTIQGCIEGWRRNGFLPMIGNELRRAGGLSILVEVSGIDDETSDDDVAVTLLYSADSIKRDGTSKVILPDYTYRVNPSPEFSQDFARFRGKIVNGVVTTEPLKRSIHLHEGPSSTWSIDEARMRIEFKEDGTMRAELGGYRDWRTFLAMAFFRGSDYENTIGFQAPGMYNAVRRAADGLKDPLTGEFNGISAAYEMEGVPAFIPPEQQKKLMAGVSISPPAAK